MITWQRRMIPFHQLCSKLRNAFVNCCLTAYLSSIYTYEKNADDREL